MIKTARLVLRPFLTDDVPALYDIQGNAAAMRFTYIAPSLDACRARLIAYEELRSTNGYAPWTVAMRDSGRIIGWGGLGIDPGDPDWGPEVSYALHPDFWGLGIGTELVQRSLTHAFDELSLVEIGAFSMPENLASSRILVKCEFNLIRFEPRLERNYFVARRKLMVV